MPVKASTPAKARAVAGPTKARTSAKARAAAGLTVSRWAKTRANRDLSHWEDRWKQASGPPSFYQLPHRLRYFYACKSVQRIYGLWRRYRPANFALQSHLSPTAGR